MVKCIIVWLLVMGMVLVSGCEVDPKGFDTPPVACVDSCAEYDFLIKTLGYAELPNTNSSVAAATDTSFMRDEDGVMVSEFHG